MLDSVSKGDVVISGSGYRFEVLHLAKHGQDCSFGMIVYTNLEPTSDTETGDIWVMSESLFLKLFNKE